MKSAGQLLRIYLISGTLYSIVGILSQCSGGQPHLSSIGIKRACFVVCDVFLSELTVQNCFFFHSSRVVIFARSDPSGKSSHKMFRGPSFGGIIILLDCSSNLPESHSLVVFNQ